MIHRKRFRLQTVRNNNPAVFLLLAAMVTVYILQLLLHALGPGIHPESILGLTRSDVAGNFAWYQPLTYIFLHDPSSPLHLLINGMVIWGLGRELEAALGKNRFLVFFFLAGAFGGLAHALFSPVTVIGASASVFALLLAYAVYWPTRRLYLFMVFPVRAVVLVLVLAALETALAFGPSSVSHTAHLGGLVAGGAMLLFFRRTRVRERILERNRERHRAQKERLLARQELERQRVDGLLDKISREGLARLSRRERRFLDRASGHYSGPGGVP